METLSALSFNVALGLAATAITLVSLRRSTVHQPAAIAIPIRSNEK